MEMNSSSAAGQPMKILVITADYPPVPSGEANHAYYLARNLAACGGQVTVVTSAHREPTPSEGVTVLPMMQDWGWREGWRLAQFVRRTRPDAIVLIYLGMMYQDHPMISFAPTLAHLLRPSSRFVTQVEHLTLHKVKIGRKQGLARRVARTLAWPLGADRLYGTLLRDSDRVIILSEMHRQALAERHPAVAQKSDLVPPPPIMKVLAATPEARRLSRQKVGANDTEIVFAYYGYIYPGKGVETLLEAFQKMNRRAQARLVIIGGFREHVCCTKITESSKRYADSMLELPRRLGIENQVHWTGTCPADGPEASNYLRGADVCVLPFDMGVHLNNSSVAAAMVHGLPVVSTAAPTSEAVFRQRENILLCPPKDPAGMAQVLDEIVESDTLRTRLRQGAEGLAREWFSWETTARRTLELLKARR